MAPSTSSRSRKEKGSSSTSINEEKYRQLKRKMKDVLQEHDHLSSKLKKARSKISHLKREKDLLLDRLDRFEGPITSSSDSALSSLSETDSESDISSDGSQDLPSAKRQRTAEGATNLSQLPSREPSPPPSNARAKKGTTRKPFTSKLRKIQPVPRDEFGNPVLPLHLGITTLYALGTIVHDRKNFHTERYIYPVGYKASRTYASMVNPERGTVYTCSITDGGDGPRFNIVPEDAPEKAVTATSATGAWTAVIKVANALRKREHSNSASGPDYFGFAHPTIASLIQELPGVELCKNYVAQKFEEQEPIKRGGTKGDKSSTRQSSASPPDNPGLKPSNNCIGRSRFLRNGKCNR
ncbi:F/Y-rich N-terminus-domain-containing protein [Fimicolochytrium jonesii]|uniref:F/Y-rich N-terminus-domain-containing protein n=1 Tax=Fimicolochytrium jonesii TaxID=1396493 RepID=UPI0022FEF116|nr:F/Y-rich N-terminus-domain-containing protein [Fimicolochytrium jonesii]KAI8823514.1 F/Y-rich N-terminus-domain-containing protein [Fimicolochytrium jonesii]